ncbi:unnamed protein product [Schistocephalus solidus]|uniref:Tubulin-specific chaperone E n=1 Tax=Schistocephalus solidus TaxID=70667 RepID=A0A183SKP4_SCHSO|nr:unnamed protein product [Schistocephalus solidus]
MESLRKSSSRLPNVFDGSEIGVIREVTNDLIGARVMQREQRGTIKYVGTLANSPAVWIGVDWDSPDRGRHNGSYKGVKYFDAHGPTSASFVKPDKLTLGTSLEEALVTRYVLCAECQILTRNSALLQPGGDPSTGVRLEIGENAGHLRATLTSTNTSADAEYTDDHTGDRVVAPLTVELFTSNPCDHRHHEKCGAAGAESALRRLRTGSVPGIPVFRCLRDGETEGENPVLWPSTGGRLSFYLPNLVELDLSYSLLSKWTELARICRQLPTLRMLNVSGNHMRLPPTANDNIESLLDSDRRLQFDVDTNPSQAEDLCSTSFTTLHHLAAVRMSNMSWAVLKRIMSWMPSIKEICVAYNPPSISFSSIKLGDFPSVETPDGQSIAETFSGLETLDLTSTELTDFDRVLEVVGSAPHLTSLLLNGNKIRTLRLPTTSPPMLRALNQIGLRDNLLEDWESVNELARLPVLTTLILRQNPILLNCNPNAAARRFIGSFCLDKLKKSINYCIVASSFLMNLIPSFFSCSETARQEIIARLPKLKSLNFLEVAADERRGAELDYLKRYSKTWKEAQDSVDTKAMFAKQHPTFLQICEKYGPPDASDGKVSVLPYFCPLLWPSCNASKFLRYQPVIKSLKEGLLRVHLLCEPPAPNSHGVEHVIERKVPARITINHLRTLVRRVFQLPPQARIDLISLGCRPESSDVEVPLEADTRELGFYGVADGDKLLARWRT